MPAPDHVTVALDGREVTIAWDTRQALLRRLQHVQETGRIRASFDAAGASRPVELNAGQRSALLIVLEQWSLDGDGFEAMPQGLFELRNALYQDLRNVDP